jgi:hypothetical protein
MNSNLLPTDLADKADFLMYYYKMPFSNSTVLGKEPENIEKGIKTFASKYNIKFLV